MFRTVLLVGLALIATTGFASDTLTPSEQALLKAFGPWSGSVTPDPSNRYSGSRSAIEFGKVLFFDPRISRDSNLSCASCHRANNHFSDGLARPSGTKVLDRNTIALANLRHKRWFGWAGRTDTLWGQSIHPLVSPLEMNMPASLLVDRLKTNEELKQAYETLFESSLGTTDAQTVLVNSAKALAAFQETITTPRTSFDDFRDAVVAGDVDAQNIYPPSAKRGLKTFLGRGNCAACHFGPDLTNSEFANIGRSHFIDGARVDEGRFGGLEKLKSTPYTRAGSYSDEPAKTANKAPANFVTNNHATWGQFRVPSLRNVANTGPYMHDGSLKSLEDVVDYYNAPDMERMHSAGVQLVKPLELTPDEKRDLVIFLRTLSKP